MPFPATSIDPPALELTRASTGAPPRPGLAGLPLGELEDRLAAHGEPPYRAGQVLRAFWHGTAGSWQEVSALPAALRESLDAELAWSTLKVVAEVAGDAGATLKAGLSTASGTVEAVLMRYAASERGRARATVCISSQIGCAVGCPFCATGDMGFLRNLGQAEIVDQVLWAARLQRLAGSTLSNVVFMGMGEPLANYEAVVGAIRALTDPGRLGLSARSVTLSTCGLVPQIERLAGEGLAIGLAISLHATNDALRDRMVPVNRKWPLQQLLAAGATYAARTGRRVTYEYIVLPEQNDSAEEAKALARAARSQRAHINLIPANLTGGAERPSGRRLKRFAGWIEEAGGNVTVRANRGTDVMAACGQLATHLQTQRVPARASSEPEQAT